MAWLMAKPFLMPPSCWRSDCRCWISSNLSRHCGSGCYNRAVSSEDRPGGVGESHLEGRGSPLGEVAHDDFGVVVFENAQQADQVGVAARLPQEGESGVWWGPSGAGLVRASEWTHSRSLYAKWPHMLTPRHERKQMAQLRAAGDWSRSESARCVPAACWMGGNSGSSLPDGRRVQQVEQDAVCLR
jgi:hypothetical protein